MVAPVSKKPLTGKIYVDGIIEDGVYWNQSKNGGFLEYSFWNSGTGSFDDFIEDIITDPYDWENYEKEAMEQALQLWANVANINFVQSADDDPNATFGFYVVDSSQEPNFGSSYTPFEGGQAIASFNWEEYSWSPKGLQQGGYGFITLIHELGHGLGLKHPHDSPRRFPGVTGDFDPGDFRLNQGVWTTMSYVDGLNSNELDPEFDIAYGYQGTPMALDIAAVQHLYGANLSYRTGNDVYQLPKFNRNGTFYSCIWDSGGIDEISNAGGNRACRIDLNEAPLVGANAGGFISSVVGIYGGFTIANGVVIENGVGGNKNDMIIGNTVDNVLNGGLGVDTLKGSLGNDTYIVDRPGDRVRESIGEGIDTIQSSASYTLPPNVENLNLTGSASVDGLGNNLNNTIRGNSGDNLLSGGAKSDTLIGGGGTDFFKYRNLSDSLLSSPDHVQDFETTDTGDLFLLKVAPSSFSQLGAVPKLDAPGIASILTGNNFPSRGVATFTLGNRIFIALNDRFSGYQPNYDAIVEITGIKGTMDLGDFVAIS